MQKQNLQHHQQQLNQQYFPNNNKLIQSLFIIITNSKQQSQQFQMESQRKIIDLFKQFVNTVLIKHFKSSEETMAQWNYFSSLMSQQALDLDKINVYLNVLSPASTNNQLKPLIDLKTIEQKKTNSGIYKKQLGGSDNIDFSLNRTVGGNADRIKFTGMFPARTNFGGATYENKDKKVKGSGKLNPTMFALIDGMEQMHNRMFDNHGKMQSEGKGSVGEIKFREDGGGSLNGNGNYFYKPKLEEKIY